jgi:hypothetical protein
MHQQYNYSWTDEHVTRDTSDQWIEHALEYFELALQCLEDYALMQQQDCDRFPLHLFFDVKLLTTLLSYVVYSLLSWFVCTLFL